VLHIEQPGNIINRYFCSFDPNATLFLSIIQYEMNEKYSSASTQYFKSSKQEWILDQPILTES
jgi:hypothetical protein